MSTIPEIEAELLKAERLETTHVLRLTPGQWRSVLEDRNFLDRPDNRFQHPRRFLGAPVQIIPDESFR